MNVQFNGSLTQAQYDALVTKDAGTLYFTTDTKRIFKGSERYSTNSGVTDVQYNSSTKVLTISYINGTTGQLNLAAELEVKLDKKPNGTDNLIDMNGKIASVYLPDSLIGQLNYSGTFDASDGSLINDLRVPPGRPFEKSDYLIALVAGNTLPDGSTSENAIAVGDWALFDGEYWDVIPNTDAVSSVNGKTGAVVLDKNDIGLGNVDDIQQATKTEFTTHDSDNVRHITNTERSNWNAKTSVVVENVLNSTSTVNALSAYQGKVLNDKVSTLETALTWQ